MTLRGFSRKGTPCFGPRSATRRRNREPQRSRLEVRNRGIPGWPELSWAEAESVRERYEPWQDDRLVLDTVHPLDVNREALHSYLRH